MAKKIDITGLNIPKHVAIILDGNGRWAKKRFLPRNAGHRPRTGRAAVHAGSAPDAALRAKDQLRLRILCLRVVAPGTAEIAALQKHGGPHAGSIMERHALDIRNEQLLHGAASVSSPRRSRVSY